MPGPVQRTAPPARRRRAAGLAGPRHYPQVLPLEAQEIFAGRRVRRRHHLCPHGQRTDSAGSAGRGGEGSTGQGRHRPTAGALQAHDRTSLLRASADSLRRDCPASAVGQRVHRLHPRPLPEAPEKGPGAERLLMAEPTINTPANLEELMLRSAAELNPRRRRQLLNLCRPWWQPETVTRFYDEVVRLIHVDVEQAERMARSAAWLAERLGDDASRAAGLRAMGHILYRKRKYLPSLNSIRRRSTSTNRSAWTWRWAALSTVRCRA